MQYRKWHGRSLDELSFTFISMTFQKSVLIKPMGRTFDHIEWHSRSFRDVEQGMLAVRKIQRPQHGPLKLRAIGRTAERIVKSGRSESRLALRFHVEIDTVSFEQSADLQRLRK